MRRSVSGATPTVKEDCSKDVTVRQVPLTLMLSPRWQSPKISEALEMVMFVPPSSAWGLSSETTIDGLERWKHRKGERIRTSNYLDNSGKHDLFLWYSL